MELKLIDTKLGWY